MKIATYIVGNKYQSALMHAEGSYFDLTDGGAFIPIYFYRPDSEEIQQFKSDSGIKMAYVARDNVIIMLMKFGSLNWMDAPYTPHLSKNLTHLPESVGPSEGISAHLLLFDTSNGELVTQRFFSLRSKLSNDLIRDVRKLKNMPYNEHAYNEDINAAYRYSTNELVEQSLMIYRVQ